MKVLKNRMMMAMSLIAMCLMTFSSCKKSSDDITELVPSDVTFVANFNAESIIKNAGCSIDNDGVITLSPEINDVISGYASNAEVNKVLSKVACLDLSKAYIFVDESGESCMVMKLRDPESAASLLKELIGEGREAGDGYVDYRIERDAHVVTRDEFIWVAQNVDFVKESVKKASKSSIKENAPAWAILEKENTLNLAVALGKLGPLVQIPKEYRSYWVGGSFNLSGPKMECELLAVDADGKAMTFEGVASTIGSDVFKYVPTTSENHLIMACGEPGKLLENYVRPMMIRETGNRDERMFIQGFEGPAAFSMDCAYVFREAIKALLSGDGRALDDRYKFFTYSPFKLVAKFDDYCVNYVTSQFSQLFNRYDSNKGEIYIVENDGIKAFAGNFGDNYLGVSNMSEESFSNSTEVARRMADMRLAGYCNLSKSLLSDLGVDFGVDMFGGLSNDRLFMEITLTNTGDEGFIRTMIKTALSPDFQSIMMKVAANNRSYYYYDDYDYGYDEDAVEWDYDYEPEDDYDYPVASQSDYEKY